MKCMRLFIMLVISNLLNWFCTVSLTYEMHALVYNASYFEFALHLLPIMQFVYGCGARAVA